MTDALSESSRAAAHRHAAVALCAAIATHLEARTEASADAMARSFDAAHQLSDDPPSLFEWWHAGAMIVGLLEGSEEVWAQFMANCVELEEPGLLARFRRLAPFGDVLYLLLIGTGRNAVLTGEMAAFRAKLAEAPLVEMQRFSVDGGGPFRTTLLLFRPLAAPPS